MPPKKKGKAKGGSGGIIDGVDTSQMSREQIEIFAHRIKEENEREREERNFFQVERDKLRTFWEITKTELDETRAALRNKDRQIEETVEKNNDEIKSFKQKVKHLQYEHQYNLTEARAEALVSLKLAQDDHAEQERELLRDINCLKLRQKELEVANLDQMKTLKLSYSETLAETRKDFENQTKELNLRYEKEFKSVRIAMDTKRRMEISEVEERKNTHITDLTKNHEKAFHEIKNYYNDITLNNLALISSLKDQMEVLRNQNEGMTKQCADLTRDNKRLAEPLKKAQADVMEYQRTLENYEKDKLSLANCKAKLSSTKTELNNLKWVNQALELQFEKLEAERNTLHNRFISAILEVQQKTGLKNALLQNKVAALNETNERQEAVIGELSVETKESPEKINEKLEQILAKKNLMIRDLKYEVAKVTKAHAEFLETYQEKMLSYGIPKEEMGSVSVLSATKEQDRLARSASCRISNQK